MSGLLLTDVERQRFIQWLDAEVFSAQQMLEQLGKLGPHTDMMASHFRREISAKKFVADELRSTESMTL